MTEKKKMVKGVSRRHLTRSPPSQAKRTQPTSRNEIFRNNHYHKLSESCIINAFLARRKVARQSGELIRPFGEPLITALSLLGCWRLRFRSFVFGVWEPIAVGLCLVSGKVEGSVFWTFCESWRVYVDPVFARNCWKFWDFMYSSLSGKSVESWIWNLRRGCYIIF